MNSEKKSTTLSRQFQYPIEQSQKEAKLIPVIHTHVSGTYVYTSIKIGEVKLTLWTQKSVMKFYSWGQVKLICFLKTNSLINQCE